MYWLKWIRQKRPCQPTNKTSFNDFILCTSINDDSANILSAMSSSSTVNDATNLAEAKADNISFTPFASTVIFSAAIPAAVGLSVTLE